MSGATICDVLPSAAALLGVSRAPDPLDMRERLGEAERVVVLLVDGLGYHLMPKLAGVAPLLAAISHGRTGHLEELASTFPSTTPTSLVSLGTGARPGEHGVLGFTVNVPGTDRVLTHIMWRDDPPPHAWQPVETWYERIARSGVPTRAVLPSMFAGSGLTDAAYRGAEFRGVERGEDYAQRLLAEIAAAPGLVYGYTAALDTAAHVHGIASEQWQRAAAGVDALLARVVDGVPPGTVLLVTADHGGLDVGNDARIDVAAEPDLRSGVRVIAGEPRVRYVHAVPGGAEDVLAAWREVLGARAQVLRRDDAIGAGWFGPVPSEHRDRIGDVVAVCAESYAVLATDREPPEVARLIGFHGALTPVETAIPLISVRS